MAAKFMPTVRKYRKMDTDSLLTLSRNSAIGRRPAFRVDPSPPISKLTIISIPSVV